MTPEFSHNKDNRIRFTKLLFQLTLLHGFSFYPSLSSFFFLYLLTMCKNLERKVLIKVLHYQLITSCKHVAIIKTHNSESRGQEEAGLHNKGVNYLHIALL